MRIRPLDLAVALLASLAVVLTALAVYAPRNSIPEVVISGSTGEWIYPIEKDRSVEVPGPLGVTTVVILEKSVRITDSPCKNKLCIAMGSISVPGQWIACLPNKVFVRIGGRTKQAEVDAGVY